MRNVMPKFQSCKGNGVDTIANTYISAYIDTKILLNLGNTYLKKIEVIEKTKKPKQSTVWS